MISKKEWALVVWNNKEKKWEKCYAAERDKHRLLYHQYYTDMSTTFTLEDGLEHLSETFRLRATAHYALFNIFTAEMIDGSIIQE